MKTEAWSVWFWSAANSFTGTHQKVINEAKEFAAEPSLEEAADVFIALVVACQHSGWDPSQLETAVRTKMAINRSRTWEKAPDGTFQHCGQQGP